MGWRWALVAVAVVASAACSSSDSGPSDASAGDAGSADAQPDARSDAGMDAARDAGPDPAEAWAELSSGLDARPAAGECVATDNPPDRLSETGCFDGMPPEPVDALIPYDVRVPLWSDGAVKQRYVIVPEGTRLEVDPSGDMTLPVGGVTVKTFILDGRRLETRFVVKTGQGEFDAYSYAWNEAQTQAQLAREGTTIGLADRDWKVPSTEQCFECHTSVAKTSLGLEAAQLNRQLTYESTGRTANQLATWVQLDLLSAQPLGLPEEQPALAPLDGGGAVTERARSYLHANCSQCHQPGGGGGGQIDLRRATDFAFTFLCEVQPQFGSPLDGGMLVDPGEPQQSILFERMRTLDPQWRMPPLATAKRHEAAVAVVEDWIAQMDGCP
jgi:uncharacterized repeat protein (TIGR03806 family)